MPHDVIPDALAELDRWARTFDAGIAADPGAVGIDPLDAAHFHDLRVAFSDAYATAAAPHTRTRPNLSAQTQARLALRAEARRLIRSVKAHPGVSPAQLISLGLTPRRATRVRSVPVPSAAPIVHVDCRGRVRVSPASVRGAGPAERRARPGGTVGALIFVHVGDAPASTDAFRYAALATRGSHLLRLDRTQNGRTLRVTARWVSRRGVEGPASAVVSTTISV